MDTERRIARDGQAYTRLEFNQFYEENWLARWQEASPTTAGAPQPGPPQPRQGQAQASPTPAGAPQPGPPQPQQGLAQVAPTTPTPPTSAQIPPPPTRTPPSSSSAGAPQPGAPQGEQRSWVRTPFFTEVLPQKDRDLQIAFPRRLLRRRMLRCRYCNSLQVIGICEDCREPFCRRHGVVLPEVAICFTCVHDNYGELMKVK